MSSLRPSLSSPLTPSLILPQPPPPPSLPSLRTAGLPHSSNPGLHPAVRTLHLKLHPEGGYFAETDRDPRRVPNPFFIPTSDDNSDPDRSRSRSRNASTTIFYLLTIDSPKGVFHRNKARTVHMLHQGRGRYVIIHPWGGDEEEESEGEKKGGEGGEKGLERRKARIETFVVGQNIDKGERLQWIVEGGKWKASFLLPDDPDGEGKELFESESKSDGLLISEVSQPVPVPVPVPVLAFSLYNILKKSQKKKKKSKKKAERDQTNLPSQNMGWYIYK